MPSCKLTIVFDRPERTFTPGEEVTGYVEVRADAEVACKELTLENIWRTHGKGNTARSPANKQTLFSGTWRAGDYQRYPFQFIVPERPFTYRGNYLNVDHYVLARADVPWALDPKAEEEFIVLPGPTGTGPLELLAKAAPKPAGKAKPAIVIGAVMIGAGIFTFPCGIPFAIIGLVVLFFAIKQQMAESRLGVVHYSLTPQLVAPGDTMSLDLSFTPRKSTSLNQIYAQLTCNEVCVSGSGTNKSTHTHNVHTHREQLSGERSAAAGQPVRLQSTFKLPDTLAYSFEASDNNLLWEVEVRIDIPRWPDWVEKRKLIVVPRGHAGPVTERLSPVQIGSPFAAIEPIERAEIIEESPVSPTPLEPLLGRAQRESVMQNSATATAPASPYVAPPVVAAGVEQAAVSAATLSLAEAMTQIAQADRFGGQRQKLIDACLGLQFSGEIVVERVNRNFSHDDDPRFREGRIVTGKPAGADITVTVKTPKSQNEVLDALQRDDRWTLNCTLHKWDDLFNRAELRVVV